MLNSWIEAVVTGLIVLVVGGIITFVLSHTKKTRKCFRVRWRGAQILNPAHLLPVRSSHEQGFRLYYLQRPEDEEIRKAILGRQNVLVVGPLLVGKTRAVYESLRSLPGNYDVSVVKEADFTDFRMPLHFRRIFNHEVVVLDDVDRLATRPGFQAMLEAFVSRKAIIVATCRSETNELAFERLVRNWSALFLVRVELGVIDSNVMEEARKDAGLDNSGYFYGPIGSLFLPLGHLKTQLHDCSPEEVCLLGVLSTLHMAGALSVKEGMPESTVQEACASLDDLVLSKRGWRELVKGLSGKGFLSTSSARIRCEEVLLEEIVEGRGDTAACVELLLPVFSTKPDVLL